MDYINNLFPRTVEEIENLYQSHEKQFLNELEQVYNIPENEHNFKNVIKKLDDIGYTFSKFRQILELLASTHPEEAIRNMSQEYQLKIGNVLTTHISTNKKIYELYKNIEKTIDINSLTEEEQYYFNESLIDMVNEGLHLPEETLNQINTIKTKIIEIGTKFDENIQSPQNNRYVFAKSGEVDGLGKEFLKSKYDKDSDSYKFGVDYPTYKHVIDNSTNERVRKEIYYNFNKIADPENQEVLSELIETRNKLSKILGYSNYTDYEYAPQMVKTSQRVQTFYDTINPKFKIKSAEELNLLKTTYQLSELNPWDVSYYTNKYNKEFEGVDEKQLKKYFPVNETFNRILNIYTQFFGIHFEEIDKSEINLWHNTIKVVKATKNGEVLGHIVCDLFPRKNKYSHMCCFPISVNMKSGEDNPALAVVLANFPKNNFVHDDVITFFHEFGHAIHQLVGTSSMKTTAGCSVRTDFVECPSQLLEEWLWEKDVLKQIAIDKDGNVMPEELMDLKINSRHKFAGIYYIRQSILGQVSFSYYAYNMINKEDRDNLWKKLITEYQNELVYDSSIDLTSRFGHLYGYGGKYYSYLWSKMIAIEIYDKLKSNNGILDSEWGDKYINEIIGKGGCQDELKSVESFLGHPVNFNSLDKYFNAK